jgi:hypothetical protein
MIKGAQKVRMKNATTLLVEDNSDDEVLTVRALKKNKVGNQIFLQNLFESLACIGSY